MLLPHTEAAFAEAQAHGWQTGWQLHLRWEGSVVADTARGDARLGLAMTPHSIVPWLSAGKPITAIALAQLRERGQLTWDDPVARHVPEFAGRGKGAITLRHLLTHTAGLRSADKLPDTLSWAEMLARVCDAPIEPLWVPGKKEGYHRAGTWLVLGEVIQRLSGEQIGQYVRRHIFEPLQVTDAWMGMPAEQYAQTDSRRAWLYQNLRQPGRPDPFWTAPAAWTPSRPGGGMCGPISALARVYEMLLAGGEWNGTRILRADSVAELTARQARGLYDHTLRHAVDYGFGFMLPVPGVAAHQPYGFGAHASDSAFGHGGAQSSCAFADPEHRLVVAWFCNGMPGELRHQERARAINNGIYLDLAAVP